MVHYNNKNNKNNNMSDYGYYDGYHHENHEKEKMEIAKDIMIILDNDQEIMDNFQFLLRQKKLKKIKQKY